MIYREFLCAIIAAVAGGGLAYGGEPKSGSPIGQQETALQKVKIPGAGFSLVIVTAKLGSAIADFRKQPDPNLVYLADGELVYSYTGRPDEVTELNVLQAPASSSFHVERGEGNPRAPVAIHVTRTGEASVTPAAK